MCIRDSVTALSFSALSTAAVFLVGATTGAKADDGWRWAAVAGLILAGGLIFGPVSYTHLSRSPIFSCWPLDRYTSTALRLAR